MSRSDFTTAALSTLLLATLGAAGCTSLPSREQRPAKSSLGCMKAAIDEGRLDGLPDDQAHCLAAGLIARSCSVTEAMLASIGKEIKDLVGPGDAEWRDLRSDRRGVACARTAANADELRSCCVAR